MTEILNTKLVCVYVGLRKWKIPSTLCIMCRFSPHHYLQKPTLTVTADDHYKNTCKFEQYWKMCKQPGHLTGSDKCRSFVAHQEDIGCFEYSRKDDPLSDFPTEFKIFRQTYLSSEHAFYHTRSVHSGDLNWAEVVRKAKTALDAKRVGGQVMKSDAYVMKEVLEAKLLHCSQFRNASL